MRLLSTGQTDNSAKNIMLLPDLEEEEDNFIYLTKTHHACAHLKASKLK